MLRLRWGFLALASGLLITTSGCLSLGNDPCSESRMFPRLFSGSLVSRPTLRGETVADCDCHSSHLTPGMEFGAEHGMPFGMPAPAPMIAPMPSSMPIPITNVPANQPTTQPPAVFRMPTQASPTPYVPIP